jgi:plasmid stabilization system protein ParE
MPLAIPLILRHQLTGIRRLAVDRYLIVYHIDDNDISIIHVLHGARDFELLLFPQG